MAVDSGIASRGYRKSLQGYRNSLQGFRKTLQGYRKSLQGYRNSLQRFRKSLQGFRKSLQGYRKSPEGARKSPEGSRSSNFDSVVSFRVAETTRNPRRQNATRSTAGDPSPSSRLWMTHRFDVEAGLAATGGCVDCSALRPACRHITNAASSGATRLRSSFLPRKLLDSL